MPSANSAAGVKPIMTAPAVRRRVRDTLLAAGLGMSLLMPAGLFAASTVAASMPGGSDCRGYSSTSRPPDYIRVYRNRSGRIERIPFRRYVVVVLGKEWPSYLPHALVEAGAVAAKQYAWYHVLQGPRRTRDGRCFDVRDGIQDQLYRPHRSRVRRAHYAAVDKTWDVTLIKNGRFFMTGYRRGYKGRCGRNATGWKLFARTATRCALRGKSYLQILRIYYGPDLTIRGAHTGSSLSQAASAAEAALTTEVAPTTQAAPTTDAALTAQSAPTAQAAPGAPEPTGPVLPYVM